MDRYSQALGDSGPARITNIISAVNGGPTNPQHLQSGLYHGHPYGLAFDMYVYDPSQAEADTRALRLQGVAAWYRGPGAPGPAGYGGLPHLHCVWPGAPTSNPVNLEQVASFAHGYRATNNEGARKEDWVDPSIKPDEIASVTRAYYLVKGRKSLDKVTTYDALNSGR